jgi:hypothetical protein
MRGESEFTVDIFPIGRKSTGGKRKETKRNRMRSTGN